MCTDVEAGNVTGDYEESHRRRTEHSSLLDMVPQVSTLVVSDSGNTGV